METIVVVTEVIAGSLDEDKQRCVCCHTIVLFDWSD